MSTFDPSTFQQRRAHFLDCCAAHPAGESRATTDHQARRAELKSFSITSLSARAAKFLQQTSQSFSVSTSSMGTAWPYRVRGRKETEDLIKNFQQERRRELDELGQRQFVSRFSKGSRLALQTTLLVQHQSHQRISNLKLQNLHSDLYTICPKPFGERAAYLHNPTSPSVSKPSARLAITAASRPCYVTVELETKKMSELIKMFEQGRTKELDEHGKYQTLALERSRGSRGSYSKITKIAGRGIWMNFDSDRLCPASHSVIIWLLRPVLSSASPIKWSEQLMLRSKEPSPYPTVPIC